MQHRRRRLTTFVAVASAALMAHPVAGQTAQCSSLIHAFDNLRDAVEGELDALWGARLADFDAWGNKLTAQTLLKGMALIHRWEDTRENLWRNTLRVGPQMMNLHGVTTGDLRVLNVAGDRTWMTHWTNDEKKVRVTIRKTGGRARTTAVVCRWSRSGEATVVDQHIFSNDRALGQPFVVDLPNLDMEFITVFLDNHSAANQFEYRVRTQVLETHSVVDEIADEEEADEGPGFVVDNPAGPGERKTMVTLSQFRMDMYPETSNGQGSPLHVVDVFLAVNSHDGSKFMNTEVIPGVIDYGGNVIAMEHKPGRITRPTGVSYGPDLRAGADNETWLGTFTTRSGDTYRVRLLPR